MDEAEIDLLQGRLARIIVTHYTKHILEIARKYHQAYKPYYKIMENLTNINEKGILIT